MKPSITCTNGTCSRINALNPEFRPRLPSHRAVYHDPEGAYSKFHICICNNPLGGLFIYAELRVMQYEVDSRRSPDR